MFLHADTRLEAGWAEALVALPDHVVGGAFRFAVDSPLRRYRPIEAGAALRCRLLGLPYGDQGLFCRRSVYQEIGGFPPLSLMEDVAFARRLRRAGRLAFPHVRALTSCRRWERHGLLGTTLRNWWLVGLYCLGWPPDRLARLYYAERPGSGRCPTTDGGRRKRDDGAPAAATIRSSHGLARTG